MADSVQSTVACPGCGSLRCQAFFNLQSVPTRCNVLYPSHDAAVACDRGDIRLFVCLDCGLIFNALFDPALVPYDSSYENALHFSGRFQQYADQLAADLVARHQLVGKTVAEIGCGDGDFLRRLLAAGAGHAVGIDPSYRDSDTTAMSSTADSLVFVTDLFDAHRPLGHCDLICCRHVLEHIAAPHDFLSQVAAACPQETRTGLYFEVPNALATLEQNALWDILYEHCSYFTADSLSRLFQRHGFNVQKTSLAFGSQYVQLHAVGSGQPAVSSIATYDPEPLLRTTQSFHAHFAQTVDHWSGWLDESRQQGKRTVLWGAGTKGIMFLNACDPAGTIECVVDVNPRKTGCYVAGTGQPIVSPETLCTIRPDVVLLTNRVYEAEIRGQLASLLPGHTMELIAV